LLSIKCTSNLISTSDTHCVRSGCLKVINWAMTWSNWKDILKIIWLKLSCWIFERLKIDQTCQLLTIVLVNSAFKFLLKLNVIVSNIVSQILVMLREVLSKALLLIQVLVTWSLQLWFVWFCWQIIFLL